ncbi:MAG TPA: hypothetical protein VGQ24_05225 [Gemmatimonadales bacterium]|jgi:hypothetical protein|nr:hypothetical protein [Gemmatimonadales bacterium]
MTRRWLTAGALSLFAIACTAGPEATESPTGPDLAKASQSGTTLGAYKTLEACYEGTNPFEVKFFGSIVINRLSATGTKDLTVLDFIQNMSAGQAKVADGAAFGGLVNSAISALATFNNIQITKANGNPLTEIAGCGGPDCDPNEALAYEATGPFTVTAGQIYRNTANITITNHSGWLAGSNNCPTGDPRIFDGGCPFGPSTKFSLTVPQDGFPACGGLGCTLTQGYWKTHSSYGPASADPGWFNIGDVDGDATSEGPDELFFGTGLTWYQMFNTTPQFGNAYVILAHQYEAAVLNVANGASSTAIAPDLALAACYLAAHTTTDAGPANSRQGLTDVDSACDVDLTGDSNAMIALATTLDTYNNGDLGPPHCSNPDEPDPTP